MTIGSFNVVILAVAIHRVAAAACENNTAIAKSFGAGYPLEISWKVKGPDSNTLATGIGGETKQFCFGIGGRFTVYGWDEYSDTWNEGNLRVEDKITGETYLEPWDGPADGEGALGSSGASIQFDVPCVHGAVKRGNACQCSSGKYELNYACVDCTAGKFGIAFGKNIEEEACPYNASSCPAGYYCPENTGPAATPCPAGKFGNITGGRNLDVACPYSCDAGKYGVQGKTNKIQACIDCPAGSYCNASSVRIPCPKGRYGVGVGNQSNLSSACPYLCEGGKYGKATGKITSAESCVECEIGQFGNISGSPDRCANDCPAGKRGVAAGKLFSGCVQ